MTQDNAASSVTSVWWSKAILALALVAAALLALGPLGTKAGLWGFPVGLMSLAAALALAALGIVIGVVALIVANKRHVPASRRPIYVAMVVNMAVMIFMGGQFFAAQDVPPIHNISTDVADPPQFVEIVALRGDGANPLELDAASIGPLQEQHYPWVAPLLSTASVGETFAKAVGVVQAMGMELVSANEDSHLIEATATTFWFGFKDDVAIRVRPEGEGSVVDVRSVSRVGLSDLGTNAKRVGEILERLGG
jgi:uncharacterized protein (DUF1499 family)